MNHLQTRLQFLKTIINSEYGKTSQGKEIGIKSHQISTISFLIDKIRKKINVISVRKYKIKKIFNES